MSAQTVGILKTRAKVEPNVAERLSEQMHLMMQKLVGPQVSGIDAATELNPADGHTISLLGRVEALPMTALAKMLGLPLSTTTHRIDRLVDKGIVERGRSAADRRVVEISLTTLGKDLERQMRALNLTIAKQMLKPLSSEEREQLVSLLTKINLA